MASLLQPNARNLEPNQNSETLSSTALEVEIINNPMQSNRGGNVVVRSMGDEDGVFLTWEDLWVTVNGKKGSKSILEGVTGRLGSNTRQLGKILINGHKQKLAFGTSAYLTQDDTLMTTLTVREAVYYSAQLQLPDSMSMSEKKERAEMTIKEMGLQDAMNTRIGGWGVKGISGGQKRRVSICIEILTRPKLLFLDEPTSGLDSAASYYVMSRIAKLDQWDGIRRTVVASIHQPSSEVFQLFHNLCLLSSGRTVYFGPASEATEDLEKGSDGGIPTEEAIESLRKSYKSSETYQQVQRQVAKICKQDCGTLEMKRSHAGFVTQCLVLTKRSFVNMFRDLGYYWLRLAIYVALAIGLATVFYDVGYSYGSIQARGSLIMFIFERERLNGHYGTGAFVIGNTFSALPFLLVISLIPGAIAYYPPGLQRDAEHFLYFAAVLFACMMLVESLMMTVASMVPNFLMGIITGAGIQALMVLVGGFFRYPNDLPNPFWRYPLYYIAFHKYAYQGLFKNEFEGLTFPRDNAGGPINLRGEEILRDTWQVEMSYSKWVDLAILLGMVALYRLLFLVIIKTIENVKPIVASFMSARSKQTAQVMVNPFSTPMHGGAIQQS
ncbi:abc transporter g family member 11 [Quercus suber]|uniref:Abc transporter g family member 11 n=1 Tax=Quercus suber TaxID=58331 RepID=A0AAW0IZ45_QUESU